MSTGVPRMLPAQQVRDTTAVLRAAQARRNLILHVLSKKRDDEDVLTLCACRLSEPLTAEQRMQQAATRLIMHLFLNSSSKVSEAWVNGSAQHWSHKHEWAVVRLAASTPFVADRALAVLREEAFNLNDYREDMHYAFSIRPNAPMEQWLDDRPLSELSSDSDDSESSGSECELDAPMLEVHRAESKSEAESADEEFDPYLTPPRASKMPRPN